MLLWLLLAHDPILTQPTRRESGGPIPQPLPGSRHARAQRCPDRPAAGSGRPRRRLRPRRRERPRDGRLRRLHPGRDRRRPRQGSVETTGWYDGHGTLVGYGWLRRIEATNQVEIDVYVRPSYDAGLGHEMLARLEERARELAAEAGPRRALDRHGRLPAGHPHAGLAARRGLPHGHHLHPDADRLRPDTRRDRSAAATDVVVRRVTDEADLRVAHDIDEESFLEHYGNVPISFESWLGAADRARRGPRPGLPRRTSTRRRSGCSSATGDFEHEDNAGYVRTLGVLPAGRGRGVGTALLRDYFARARTRGRTAVMLHVDVANVTGALRLYESVGMRAVLEIDAWGKGERVRLTGRQVVSSTLPTCPPASTTRCASAACVHRQHPVDHRPHLAGCDQRPDVLHGRRHDRRLLVGGRARRQGAAAARRACASAARCRARPWCRPASRSPRAARWWPGPRGCGPGTWRPCCRARRRRRCPSVAASTSSTKSCSR